MKLHEFYVRGDYRYQKDIEKFLLGIGARPTVFIEGESFGFSIDVFYTNGRGELFKTSEYEKYRRNNMYDYITSTLDELPIEVIRTCTLMVKPGLWVNVIDDIKSEDLKEWVNHKHDGWSTKLEQIVHKYMLGTYIALKDSIEPVNVIQL